MMLHRGFVVALHIKKSNQNKRKFIKDARSVLKLYDYLIKNRSII